MSFVQVTFVLFAVLHSRTVLIKADILAIHMDNVFMGSVSLFFTVPYSPECAKILEQIWEQIWFLQWHCSFSLIDARFKNEDAISRAVVQKWEIVLYILLFTGHMHTVLGFPIYKL
jgi:hypothetical protein